MNVAPSLEHAEAPDPRIAAAEARLVMLREVAEFGVTRIRERYARPGEDPIIACGRFSRAIRCALILESIIEVELAALQAGTWAPAPEPEPEPSKEKDMSAPKGPVEHESPYRETFGHILKLPFKDALKWICKELGMDGEEFLRTHPLAPLACSDPVPAPAPTPVVKEEIDIAEADSLPPVGEAPAKPGMGAPVECGRQNTSIPISERPLAQRETTPTPTPRAWEGEGSPGGTASRQSPAPVTPHPSASGGHLLPPGEGEGSAILSDLGLNPRRTGEAFPPPDPPPRITRAP